MSVVFVNTTHLMSESLPQATMSKEKVDAASVESRRGFSWDDDDEE